MDWMSSLRCVSSIWHVGYWTIPARTARKRLSIWWVICLSTINSPVYKTLGRSGQIQSGGECMPGGYRTVDHKFCYLLLLLLYKAKDEIHCIIPGRSPRRTFPCITWLNFSVPAHTLKMEDRVSLKVRYLSARLQTLSSYGKSGGFWSLRKLVLGIDMVSYIRIYKGIQLKSELRHTET